jgi:hypothetical protein
MADIASVFHWEPPVMEAMAVIELAEWRDLARRRSGAEDE